MSASRKPRPVIGPGVHQLDRAAFQALAVYNALGETEAAEDELDRRRIAATPRSAARAVLALERWA